MVFLFIFFLFVVAVVVDAQFGSQRTTFSIDQRNSNVRLILELFDEFKTEKWPIECESFMLAAIDWYQSSLHFTKKNAWITPGFVAIVSLLMLNDVIKSRPRSNNSQWTHSRCLAVCAVSEGNHFLFENYLKMLQFGL